MITVLFARKDSLYKQSSIFNVYDIDRNATTYCGNDPVIAHPPCRAWGRLSHLANPKEGEKELAYFALAQVRLCGGILEHPQGSRLWKEAKLPIGHRKDRFGGFTVTIDQYHFGHVAHKPTRLYICGVEYKDIPNMPYREGKAYKTICGITGQPGRRCTQYEREYTPIELIRWFVDVIERIK